jgi:hypothetical protein
MSILWALSKLERDSIGGGGVFAMNGGHVAHWSLFRFHLM